MNDELKQILEQKHAVWAGDVVEIFGEDRVVGRVGWRIAVIWGGAFAVLGMALFQSWHAWMPLLFFAAVFAPTVSVFYVLVAVRTRHARQKLDEQEVSPAPTLGAMARRLWERSRLDSPPESAVDAARWVRAVGPDGPRVILVDCSLLPFGADEAVFEEVAVGVDQTLGSKERKWRLIQLAFCGFSLILGLVGWRMSPGLSSGMIPYFAYAILLVLALYRLGMRPIQVGASSAVPGLVRTTRWFKPREFRRETAVLVIQAKGAALLARFSDQDGVSRQFRFFGTADPALQQLISRWCWRNDAGTHWEGRWTREHVRFSEPKASGDVLSLAAESSVVPSLEEEP